MPPSVSIDFDPRNSSLVLTGDIGQISAAPLVAAFFRSKGASPVSSTELRIPIANEDQIKLVHDGLKRVLNRYGIQITEADQISAELGRIQDEDNLFEEFARSASAIWHAQVNPSAFAHFTDVILRTCPGRTFFHLQLLSAFHLAFSQHACNFSVPGAGKTSIVYAAFAYLKSLPLTDPKHVDHLLVVGPLSSFKAWEDEYRTIFGRRAVRKRLMGGMPERERISYLRGTAADAFATELTLTSYQTLASFEPEFLTFLGFTHRRVMLVLDEAHNIKRPDGIWASAALRLSNSAASRVVLTGTPAPNGYEDLENLFEFIHPRRRIVGYNGAVLKSMSLGRMQDRVIDLKKRISPFYTRIRKRDLDLPGISEQIIGVPLAGTQSEIYRYIERLVIPSLRTRRDDFQKRLVSARLMRLRQAATNPQLLLAPLLDDYGNVLDPSTFSVPDARIFEFIREFSPTIGFAKIESLCGLVDELFSRHQRILIWSVFLGNLSLISQVLRQTNAQIDIISGAVPVNPDGELPEDVDVDTRERIIDRFLNSTGPAILIANPQSVGESISLHMGCHAAVYFDRDFNAGRFIQSKDRIHRYGLTKEVITEYFYLTVDGSIEDDIHNRLAMKESVLAKLVDEDDVPLFRLVLGDDEEGEDIRQVIESYEQRKSR